MALHSSLRALMVRSLRLLVVLVAFTVVQPVGAEQLAHIEVQEQWISKAKKKGGKSKTPKHHHHQALQLDAAAPLA